MFKLFNPGCEPGVVVRVPKRFLTASVTTPAVWPRLSGTDAGRLEAGTFGKEVGVSVAAEGLVVEVGVAVVAAGGLVVEVGVAVVPRFWVAMKAPFICPTDCATVFTAPLNWLLASSTLLAACWVVVSTSLASF